MDIFKLFATIAIKNHDANNALNETGEKAESTKSKIGNAFSKIGSAALTLGKSMAVGLLSSEGAITVLTKKAIDAYGDYEQLVGGVETLFKESAGIVEQYANNAYKTAGLSANEYMDTVTGFSASLLQSLDGDTTAAAEKANVAITDMADNANKMGTSMESIKNAYQGFAKQNYTMLDNLKLGYGGTKEEMERLLSDAEKLSGQKFDISSYADVVDAIHVIQTEMDITGTTSKEASTTIQGSVSSFKASWENLLVGMADDTQDFDALLTNVIDSGITVIENILPRIEIVANSIPKLVAGVLPQIPALIDKIMPPILQAALNLLQGIVNLIPDIINTITGMLPTILTAIIGMLPTLLQTISTIGTDLINAIVEMLPLILNSITDTLPQLVIEVLNLVNDIITALMDSMPQLIDAAVQFFLGIVEAIPQVVNAISDNLDDIIKTVVYSLINAMPQIIEGAVQLFMGIIDALPTIIAALNDNVPHIITTIISALTDGNNALLSAAVQLLLEIVKAIPDIIISLGQAVPDIIMCIVNSLLNGAEAIFGGAEGMLSPLKIAFENIRIFIETILNHVKIVITTAMNVIKGVISVVTAIIKGDWEGAWNGVKNIFVTIWNGIKNVVSNILNGIKGIFSNTFNGIKNIVSNVFNGIKNTISNVINSAKNTVQKGLDAIKWFFDKLKLKFPDLKLPHFKVDGEFSLNPPKVPKFSIDWYAKAMDEGMIMNKPTIFGVNPSGQLMGGGEAGSETVVGTQSLMNMIDRAVSDSNNNIYVVLDKILAVLNHIDSELYNRIVAALQTMGIEFDERELARLVKRYA